MKIIKKIIAILTVFFIIGLNSICEVKCEETEELPEYPDNLYALSACLMDADSGRILFEKEGYTPRAMASTTKIMTLIVTLENTSLDSVVTASAKAASQPDVQLNMTEGEQFYLKDLCYSLMLESHNDAAVAIAEHVGGSVEGFALMMNEKAAELGLLDTYYITPNGLDAENENGFHHTTATDLAKVMSYCITESEKKEEFLEITKTASWSFSNLEGTRSYSCSNHNAFLNMMEGALSGKTGFTGDAGYCYVGALQRDGKTFVVALLGCGWPNNKTYKWKDTRKLMNYGIANFKKVCIFTETDIAGMEIVTDCSIADSETLSFTVNDQDRDGMEFLLSKNDYFTKKINMPQNIELPVYESEQVGTVQFFLNDELIKEYAITADKTIENKNLIWIIKKIVNIYLI